jgi:hypothetical protein
MDGELREKIAAINAQLAVLAEDARRALRGEAQFGVEQVRALSIPVSEMAPILVRSKELRSADLQIGLELDRYKSQLGELHITLQQITMMLLARRSQMESGRVQLSAVTHWANAMSQTR